MPLFIGGSPGILIFWKKCPLHEHWGFARFLRDWGKLGGQEKRTGQYLI